MGNALRRQKRLEKKRGEKSRRADAQLDLRRRVKALLKRFQLLGYFEAMPADVREQFYDFCRPDPVLVFDPSFPSAEAFGGKYAELRDEVRAGFEHATIVLTGFVLPVKDFVSVAVPLMSMVRGTIAKFNSPLPDGRYVPPAVRTFLEKSNGVLQYLCRPEVEAEMYRAVHEAAVIPLVSQSRLDGTLLHATPTMVETFRGQRLTLTVFAEKPPTLRLGEGPGGKREPRTVYRVGTPNSWHGIEWASWSREGVKGHWADKLQMPAGAEWPVFVQGHALQRLRQRLDTFAYADWSEHWLHESMKRPKIVERTAGGELMVAYEVQGERLGYLVATVREKMVVVRTFLFLTMRGTPEGKQLSRRLKLTRDELEYLRLHELSRFTQTDLKDDPALRQIFKQCGCGHLFDLAEDRRWMVPAAGAVRPFAAELKQYVGMAA